MGKTAIRNDECNFCKKHPHACGEDNPYFSLYKPIMETPPRLWGRHCREEVISERAGNTPTPVGKTIPIGHTGVIIRKHPHACGEDLSRTWWGSELVETPPRLWGRQFGKCHDVVPFGNTPTPVGKTLNSFACLSPCWKHPHACGEDLLALLVHDATGETPPRLWGRRHKHRLTEQQSGNTPTPVGKT